jgi:hypothetical protein
MRKQGLRMCIKRGLLQQTRFTAVIRQRAILDRTAYTRPNIVPMYVDAKTQAGQTPITRI